MYWYHLLRDKKQEGQLFFSRNNLSMTLLLPPSDTIAIAQDTDAASVLNEHKNPIALFGFAQQSILLAKILPHAWKPASGERKIFGLLPPVVREWILPTTL